jgi:hypothetical protein
MGNVSPAVLHIGAASSMNRKVIAGTTCIYISELFIYALIGSLGKRFQVVPMNTAAVMSKINEPIAVDI